MAKPRRGEEAGALWAADEQARRRRSGVGAHQDRRSTVQTCNDPGAGGLKMMAQAKLKDGAASRSATARRWRSPATQGEEAGCPLGKLTNKRRRWRPDRSAEPRKPPADLLGDRSTRRYVQFHPADCLKAGTA